MKALTLYRIIPFPGHTVACPVVHLRSDQPPKIFRAERQLHLKRTIGGRLKTLCPHLLLSIFASDHKPDFPDSCRFILSGCLHSQLFPGKNPPGRQVIHQSSAGVFQAHSLRRRPIYDRILPVYHSARLLRPDRLISGQVRYPYGDAVTGLRIKRKLCAPDPAADFPAGKLLQIRVQLRLFLPSGSSAVHCFKPKKCLFQLLYPEISVLHLQTESRCSIKIHSSLTSFHRFRRIAEGNNRGCPIHNQQRAFINTFFHRALEQSFLPCRVLCSVICLCRISVRVLCSISGRIPAGNPYPVISFFRDPEASRPDRILSPAPLYFCLCQLLRIFFHPNKLTPEILRRRSISLFRLRKSEKHIPHSNFHRNILRIIGNTVCVLCLGRWPVFSIFKNIYRFRNTDAEPGRRMIKGKPAVCRGLLLHKISSPVPAAETKLINAFLSLFSIVTELGCMYSIRMGPLQGFTVSRIFCGHPVLRQIYNLKA